MLFRKSEKRTSEVLTLQDQALLEALGISVGDITADKAKEATFFACLRILSDSVSKLPLKLYKETDNGIDKANDHYLYNKLKLRPNKNMSASDFWKMVEFQRNYFGHEVVAIETLPNGKVNNLVPLDMNYVTIWVDNIGLLSDKLTIWYVYNYHGNEYRFSNDEVLHFKGLTRDGIRGMAVKDYLKTTIENLQYGANYVNSYFSGGLSAKGIMQYTGDIDPNAMNRMKERFEKMATGMNNVGKILPVPVGFNFSTINSTMADAQFLELNNLSIRQIASAFGIKQHQVNDLSGATFSNVQQQDEQFYRDTLQSILTMYEQESTYKLLTEKEVTQGYFFEFNVDSLLRTDLKTRFDAYAVGIDKGFLKPSEARRMENLPVEDSADILIVNGTYQPLKDVGMSYKTPQANSTDNTVNATDTTNTGSKGGG